MRSGLTGIVNMGNKSPENTRIRMYFLINPYNFISDVTPNVTLDFLHKAKSLVNTAFSKERYKK